MSGARAPVIALLAWTAFVWIGRIRNVIADDALEPDGRAGRLLLALSFIALAAGVTVALVRASAWLRLVVLVLAGWTIGVWVARSVGIAAGDHDAGFVAVHLALAAVSIGLAAWAARAVVELNVER